MHRQLECKPLTLQMSLCRKYIVVLWWCFSLYFTAHVQNELLLRTVPLADRWNHFKCNDFFCCRNEFGYLHIQYWHSQHRKILRYVPLCIRNMVRDFVLVCRCSPRSWACLDSFPIKTERNAMETHSIRKIMERIRRRTTHWIIRFIELRDKRRVGVWRSMHIDFTL